MGLSNMLASITLSSLLFLSLCLSFEYFIKLSRQYSYGYLCTLKSCFASELRCVFFLLFVGCLVVLWWCFFVGFFFGLIPPSSFVNHFDCSTVYEGEFCWKTHVNMRGRPAGKTHGSATNPRLLFWQ